MSINWETNEKARFATEIASAWRERAETAENTLGILTGRYIDLFHHCEALEARIDRLIGALMAVEETCRERVDAAIKEREL